MTRIAVIGHRGAGTLEPENTIRSFVRAEWEGVDELELDLRLSRDGRLVVMHDATVDRTTNGSGPVDELAWDQLRRLDAGAGESVPLFDEVVDHTALRFQAEVKSADAVTTFAATVRHRDLAERLYATSQNAAILAAIHDEVPEVELGLIVAEPTAEITRDCEAVGASVVCPRLRSLTTDMVRSLQAAGIRVVPWPVNSAEEHATVIEHGADGFATDRPDLARAWSAAGA